MIYSIIGISWLLLWTTQAQNLTQLLAKTKRNLSRDIQSYGDSSLVLPYNDNSKVFYEPKNVNTYQVRPLALVDLSQPVKVIEPKVAAQQVLYEFQQTPTDAVSNVHVKQLFEPDLKPPPPSNHQTLTAAETIIPVHQGQFQVQNAGPQTFNVKHHPLYSVQPMFIEPKKYVYGKIIVDSTHPQQGNFYNHGNPNVFYSNQHILPQGTHGRPIVNYVNHFPRNHNVMLTTTEVPIIQNVNNKFKPPNRSQYQTIETPVRNIPEEKPKRKPTEKPVVEKEEEDDDPEEKSNYNDEDDHEEYDSPFSKYSFDEEESMEYGHRENYEDEDEDAEEDNKRGSSKHILKREKFPKKYKKSKSLHSKYTSPEEKYFKNDGSRYKSYKYKHSKKAKIPKSELEARFSEHIPVTHKKKIVKEKWFLSKSSADKERFDHE